MSSHGTAVLLEHIKPIRKKAEFLQSSRIHDRKRMQEASLAINKLQRKVSGLNSVEIIRKFRGTI